MNGNIDLNNVERYTIMARNKKVEVKEFEKQLAEVEFSECCNYHSKECDGDQSKRENEMTDLLKQLVHQNEQVIQLLTKLKERFI